MKGDADQPSRRGPQGGRSTVSTRGDLVRKTLWLGREEEEAIRAEANRTRRTESALVREILRAHFGLDPDAPHDTPD